MKARFRRFAALTSRAQQASTLGLFLSLFAAGSAHAVGTPEQRKGLHAGRLSSVPRRNPQRPRHYRLPEAAKGQPERGLPGGVRARRPIALASCGFLRSKSMFFLFILAPAICGYAAKMLCTKRLSQHSPRPEMLHPRCDRPAAKITLSLRRAGSPLDGVAGLRWRSRG